ncbi:hypothetical protein CR152_15740 [Massilia violaceinigra]|uniref:Uncharacterized protein n=1 Tax=Massilia violaceinigra TaxID=2045208 RepID=A0A2D2DLF5_9BURK|nr:hypothetical protein CR152_15740 [Massilia violaceinigra]
MIPAPPRPVAAVDDRVHDQVREQLGHAVRIADDRILDGDVAREVASRIGPLELRHHVRQGRAQVVGRALRLMRLATSCVAASDDLAATISAPVMMDESGVRMSCPGTAMNCSRRSTFSRDASSALRASRVGIQLAGEQLREQPEHVDDFRVRNGGAVWIEAAKGAEERSVRSAHRQREIAFEAIHFGDVMVAVDGMIRHAANDDEGLVASHADAKRVLDGKAFPGASPKSKRSWAAHRVQVSPVTLAIPTQRIPVVSEMTRMIVGTDFRFWTAAMSSWSSVI